ncbi:MAG: chlorophyllase [Rhizobiaceae bacterium]|nr:MAG: chlorophyllase [Rhizobiaceae bacterium]
MNNLIKEARHIPVADPGMTVSYSPITLVAQERGRPLQLRITGPASGVGLPVVLLSHGHGPSNYIPSKDGYGPLVNFYAERGFVVIQPTHLNSKVGGLPADAVGGPLFWRSRVEDMSTILDRLDEIEDATPAFKGRLDREKVAVVGHSMGGQTAGMLLGARLTDPKDPAAQDVNMLEPRIKAGLILTAPGNGGDSLSEMAATNYTFFNPDFSQMTTRSLVVVGSDDASAHLTVRGPSWHEDPYHCSPGAEALMTVLGGKHGLGGISGYDARETDDEDPERLEIVLRMTWAYLRSALDGDDRAWTDARAALEAHASSQARVDLR